MTPANHDLRVWLDEVKKSATFAASRKFSDKDKGGLVEMFSSVTSMRSAATRACLRHRTVDPSTGV